MRQLFLAVVWLVLWAGQAVAAPSFCTLTGSLLLPNGDPCANCNVTIRVPRAQEVGGVTFPVKTSSYTTNTNGTLPAGVQAARTLVVEITIDKTPPITVQIPATSSADLSTLLLPPITLPTSTNINSLSSTLTVSKGGTGGPPAGDDQVLVSSSTSAASWKTLTDCNAAGEAVTYDTATNTWGCATGLGGGGSGDVTDVGDCAGPACFNGTSGNSIQFEGSTADAFETTLTATDPTADRTITMPNRTGQMALEKVVNLYDYAACDGTNEATGIQAAITAACALGPGGTLYVPADTCVYGSTLTLCSGLAIVGSDSTERVAYATAQPHELLYTGTGTAIDAQSLAGVRLSGLLLRASSGSFSTGTVLDIDGSSSIYIDRVFFIASSGQADAATSRAISANNVVGLWIEGSSFSRFGYHIYGRTLSTDDTNVVSIKDTSFYRAEACSIQNLGDFITVINSWWQAQGASDTKSNAWCHDSGICSRGLSMTGSGSVDQPNGPTVPVFDFCGDGLSIAGNFLGGGTTQDGIRISEACDGCAITGNWFAFLDEGLAITGTGNTSSGLINYPNSFTTVTTAYSGTQPALSQIRTAASGTFWNEPSDLWLNFDSDGSGLSDFIVFGSDATGGSATHQYDFSEAYANFRRGNDLRFYETDDTNYVQVSAPTLSADWTLTLPTDDGNASQFLQTDGSGVSTWATAVTGATADSGGTTTGATVTLAGGAGITTARSSDTVTFATASSEQNFLASGALTCGASTNGKMQVHTTPLQYCDNAGTPTLQYAAYGNSSGESTAAANNSVALTTDTTGDYVATITGGAGIASSGATSGEGIAHSLSTASNETDFLANGALTCGAGTRGRMQIHTTPLQYCDNAATPALQYAAYGNSSGESTAAANDSVALTTDTTGNYAAGDAEAGNATGVACTDCIALTTETTGNYVATITGGAGIASTGAATGEGIGHTLSTASDEADFLKSGALTCGASTQGKMQVHTTPLQYCDNAGTPTLQYAAYGNSSGESTAAANNSVAMGTDTTGDYVATITGGTGITSSGATSGESIAHSLSFDATEIDSPTWSNGGSASLTHTWNLSGTDPVLTLQSGAFNLTGNTLIGATGSGGSLTVNSTSNATKGSIILDDKVDLWPNIPDFSASAMEVMEFNSDLDLSGVALFHSIFHLDPTIHIGQAGGFLGGIIAVSTEGMLIAHDDATTASTNLPTPQLFWADHIIETTVAIAAPMDHVLLDHVEKRSTGAITVPTGGTHRTVWSAPKLKASTNATATYDEVSGLYWGPVAGTDFTTDGTALTVSEANAVKVANPTKDSGTGTTTYTEVNGLNCSDLTVATTNSCVKSAVTANSARYFLNDTGGAQSKLTGKFTTYNNITTAGTGLPIITGESGVSATKTADFTALSYTPPATAGRYRVEQVITTTSGTNTGSFQCTVGYVDSQGTTHTADLMPMVNQTGLWATALPVVAGASKEWHCGPTYITINNSATAIVLKVDVTTGTVNYTVAASVEQLG